jgi:uncharacterized membrane protein YkoI
METDPNLKGEIMKRVSACCIAAIFLLTLQVISAEGEKKVAIKNLPPAVQKTVQDQIKGAQLKGLSKEAENGKTVYEVETMVNGKSRDLLIDEQGAILEIEEATTLDAIPAPAKAVIKKDAIGGKVSKVEIVTKAGVTTYAAVIKKAGKESEIKVAADGSIVK